MFKKKIHLTNLLKIIADQKTWAAINKALSTIFEDGQYQWGFSGSQLMV